jgi:hypothetical protein|tara:strand:+ start:909 stop:1400 length:492 start_codon:yes stop_codon:yes gene_type:complete
MARKGVITTANKRNRFLEHLAGCGNVSESAKVAKADLSSLYGWRNGDQDFAYAWTLALEVAGDLLEAEARRRALGYDEAVYNRAGEQVDTIKKYSDRLLIFLLKGAKPDKYGDRFSGKVLHEHDVGPNFMRILRHIELTGREAEDGVGTGVVELTSEPTSVRN